MRSVIPNAIMLAAYIAISAVFPSFANAQCDRACMNSFVDQYLEAFAAHDPSRLPLAESARFTENGQTLELGDGMWGPLIRLGGYRLYFVDEAAGQAGAFQVVEENGHPAILGLRIKVENRRISEIETIVSRPGADVDVDPSGMIDQPIFSETLAPSERRSREEMIAIADSYFEGLAQNTGDLTPFEDECVRVENGIVSANSTTGSPIYQMTCHEQFDSGFFSFISEVRERRYPIVDAERGLVYAIVFFDHAGRVTTSKLKDGTEIRLPAPFDTPYTLYIGELFKIRDGKIARIEAAHLPVPYHMPSGWSGVE